MATMTLLSMVQNILSAMDSDEVNDISATTESAQVAEVIKETYDDIIASRDWPFLKALSSLTALGDVDNPTKMQFPTGVDKVFWMKYNKKDVTYLAPKDFRDIIDGRVETTGSIDANGYVTNRDPIYWTTYDDNYVYFDGYDSDTDTTLQNSKSQAYILTIPSWTTSNNFTPTLPSKMFPGLLADAKSTCFLNLKQTANAKEEKKAKRNKTRMRSEAWKNEQGEAMTNSDVNFGRS